MAFAAMSNANHEWASNHSQDTDYFPQVSYSTQDALDIVLLRSESLQAPKAAICELTQEPIPVEFPKFIKCSTAWTGTDLKNGPEVPSNSMILNAAQVAELEQACDYFQGVSQRTIYKAI